MTKIRVNDIDIYYERQGRGFPLLLICGFTNHIGMWEKIVPLLSDTHDVIVFDNRGAGRSDSSPSPYTIELLAGDVIALMDALEIEQADMVGFSMGAALIQSIGLRYAERIRKGVMIAPFAVLPPNAIQQTLSMAKLFAAGVAKELVFETILPWIFSNDYLSNPNKIKETIERAVDNPFPQSDEGYQGQLQAVINFDSTSELEKIKTELLIIAGEEDLYTPMYCTNILMEKLPNATLMALPKMGHMPQVEALDQVVEGIHAFCQGE